MNCVMNKSLLSLLAVVGLAPFGLAHGQILLVDPDFSTADKTGVAAITNAGVGLGWYRVAGGNTWTRDGYNVSNRQYSVGEMGRVNGQQNNPHWFGQVIDGNGATGDTFSLVLDARYDLPTGNAPNLLVEIYGANGVSAPDFTLDNDTMGVGWTSILSTNVTYPEGGVGVSGFQTDTINFDIGASSYDYLGFRFRTTNLGNNDTGRELAFQSISIIPEPTVGLYALLSIGAFALVRRRRTGSVA